MAAAQHRSSAPLEASIRVAVISVSDTRSPETDVGGGLVQELTARAGFSVTTRALLRDEPEAISARVRAHVAACDVDVVLLTGGTGVAPRDVTVDAVVPLLDRRLDGFGELFRMLSFAEIGPAAMLSRAIAGIAGGVAIFLMPGSPAGVRLALERLILPELAHLVGELRRQPGTDAGGAPASDDAGDSASHHDHHHRPHDHDDSRRH